MVDQIPQKRILRPWNQWESHCLHRRPHIWNSCTSGASRHHGTHEGTPAWTKAKPSWSGRSHWKTYRPVQVRIYTICVELAIFHSKGQCATEIQLLNTPHDRRCCRGRQAMTPLWCSSINMLWFPQKTVACTFAPGAGGDSDTCHQDCVVTIALDSSFNLLLISRILVGTNGNGRHHVIIGINHG